MVSYKETITVEVSEDYKHKKQSVVLVSIDTLNSDYIQKAVQFQ